MVFARRKKLKTDPKTRADLSFWQLLLTHEDHGVLTYAQKAAVSLGVSLPSSDLLSITSCTGAECLLQIQGRSEISALFFFIFP